MIRYFSLFLALTVAVGLIAPRAQSAASQASAIQVVTSVAVLADLIKNVGGDRVAVTALVPRGGEPEDYDPTPADAGVVARASLFFANGLGLEQYLEYLIESSGNDRLEVITLSGDLPTLAGFGQGGEEGGNPHLWLNPRHAIAYVDAIQQTLSQVDPDSAATYTANAASYTARLAELDRYIEQQVQTIPNAQRAIVSIHDAWPYFAERYGLRHLAVVRASHGSDPSAREYAELISVVRNNNVKAVFGEAGFSDRFISQLAADTGATYVADLYTDTLTDGPPADSYLNAMRYNADAIVNALR
jgi:manganese/iron transport system substrate-binding protein